MTVFRVCSDPELTWTSVVVSAVFLSVITAPAGKTLSFVGILRMRQPLTKQGSGCFGPTVNKREKIRKGAGFGEVPGCDKSLDNAHAHAHTHTHTHMKMSLTLSEAR